jgi:glycine cleavage system H protein
MPRHVTYVEERMDFPDDRLYSEFHLWVKIEENQATIGITDFAKEELGDVDYIELPQLDDVLSRNKAFGIIETSKAVTDLISPISGTVLEVNDLVVESPETLVNDPYEDGWLIVVEPSDTDEFEDLMKAKKYRRLVKDSIAE